MGDNRPRSFFIPSFAFNLTEISTCALLFSTSSEAVVIEFSKENVGLFFRQIITGCFAILLVGFLMSRREELFNKLQIMGL